MEQRLHARSTRRGNTERTARLLADDGLLSGALDAASPLDPEALRLVPSTRVPPAPVRTVQAALKSRLVPAQHERDVCAMAELRRRLLGAAATAPPRFLVRVDEFPHFQAWDDPGRYGSDAFRRFHAIMRGAGIPYLIAGLPRVSRRPLDPRESQSRVLEDEERELLVRIASEGVCIALHGRDHRTRLSSPRRRSELGGLDGHATNALLDAGLAELAAQGGGAARVFVAPYNRFERRQWPALAERFAVVGGGPESIRAFGIQPAPQWRGEAVFLPAYFPFYGRARDVLPAAERSLERALGLWTPIVLHWGWEADAGWRDLEQLAARLAPHAVDWSRFLEAVDRSR